MSKLSSKEDRDRTRASQDSAGAPIVKLEKGHNFILLLTEDYEEGFNHWIKIKDKTYRRGCVGGLEAKGWAVDDCLACELTMEQYTLKKAALEEGDKKLAEEYNDKGNKLKAGYAAVFPAVKFKSLVEKKKVKTKKGVIKTIKVAIPDYEEYEIGKLSLSHTQMDKLMDLVDEEKYERIQDGVDLVAYCLDFHKVKEGNKRYAELKEIIPSKRKITFEIDDSDLPDTSKEFEVRDDLEKLVELYKGEVYDEDEEYIEEELDKKKQEKGKGKKGKGKSRNIEEEDDDDIPF